MSVTNNLGIIRCALTDLFVFYDAVLWYYYPKLAFLPEDT